MPHGRPPDRRSHAWPSCNARNVRRNSISTTVLSRVRSSLPRVRRRSRGAEHQPDQPWPCPGRGRGLGRIALVATNAAGGRPSVVGRRSGGPSKEFSGEGNRRAQRPCACGRETDHCGSRPRPVVVAVPVLPASTPLPPSPASPDRRCWVSVRDGTTDETKARP